MVSILSIRGMDSVPQPLQVPPAAPAVLVEVDHRSSPGLHSPVLPVPSILPPPTLDPPPADHVADLVAPAPPQEGRRHPAIPLHHHVLVVALGHPGCLGCSAPDRGSNIRSMEYGGYVRHERVVKPCPRSPGPGATTGGPL